MILDQQAGSVCADDTRAVPPAAHESRARGAQYDGRMLPDLWCSTVHLQIVEVDESSCPSPKTWFLYPRSVAYVLLFVRVWAQSPALKQAGAGTSSLVLATTVVMVVVSLFLAFLAMVRCSSLPAGSVRSRRGLRGSGAVRKGILAFVSLGGAELPRRKPNTKLMVSKKEMGMNCRSTVGPVNFPGARRLNEGSGEQRED